MEQTLRLLHECGLPMEDVDFINSDGNTMNQILLEVSSSSYSRKKIAKSLFIPENAF